MTVGELLELLKGASPSMEVLVSVDEELCSIDPEFTGIGSDEDSFIIELELVEEGPETPRTAGN